MSPELTTETMVQAAQDAYDRAAAETIHLTRELCEALRDGRQVDELVARSMVALVEREYAWSVYVSTYRDYFAGLAVPA